MAPIASMLVPSAPAAVRGDELRKRRKLLLDEVLRLRVLDLAGLIVDACRAVADENLRLVERERIEKHHGPSQVVLHAPAAERPGSSRLQGDRLADEGLVLQAGYPVDGVLQRAGDAGVIFSRHENSSVGRADRIGERVD